MTKFIQNLCGFLVATFLVIAVPHGVAGEITYQGELRLSGSRYTGNADMKFVIVNSMTGTVIWSNDGQAPGGSPQEPATSVQIGVEEGMFFVDLGRSTAYPNMAPIPDDAFAQVEKAVLRIWVRTTGTFEQFSDQPLTAGVFAHRAYRTGGWMASGAHTVLTSGRVGIGTNSPNYSLDVAGTARVRDSLWIYPGSGTSGVSMHMRRVDTAGEQSFEFFVGGGGFGSYQLQLGRSEGTNPVHVPSRLGIGERAGDARLTINAPAGHLLQMKRSGRETWQVWLTPFGSGGLGFWNLDDQRYRLFLAENGRVGLGTATPAATLDVAGNVAINGTQIISSDGRWVGDPTGLRGPQGPQGSQGPQGPQGPPGYHTVATCYVAQNNVSCNTTCGLSSRVVVAANYPCQVTSTTGGCTAVPPSLGYTYSRCCVCASN